MSLRFLEHWDDYLPTGGGHLVAVTGAPQRRDLLAHLADRAAAHGTTVSVVASGDPTGWPAVPAVGAADVALPTACRLVPPPDAGDWGWLDRLATRRPDRQYLVDLGPEPAAAVNTLPAAGGWPAVTGLVLVVVDADAMGRPARDVVDMADPVAAAVARRSDPLEGWRWDDTVTVLAESLPPADWPPWALVVLGLDRCQDTIGLFAFLGRCTAELGVPVVTVGSVTPDGVDLRTAVETGEEEE